MLPVPAPCYTTTVVPAPLVPGPSISIERVHEATPSAAAIKPSFRCDRCRNSYSSTSNLERHKRQKHSVAARHSPESVLASSTVAARKAPESNPQDDATGAAIQAFMDTNVPEIVAFLRNPLGWAATSDGKSMASDKSESDFSRLPLSLNA